MEAHGLFPSHKPHQELKPRDIPNQPKAGAILLLRPSSHTPPTPFLLSQKASPRSRMGQSHRYMLRNPREEGENEEWASNSPCSKEMEVSGVNVRVGRRACFYTALALPQAHSNCTRAVILQQTHLENKISYVMAQIQVMLPSTLAFHFLISDILVLLCRILSCATKRS